MSPRVREVLPRLERRAGSRAALLSDLHDAYNCPPGERSPEPSRPDRNRGKGRGADLERRRGPNGLHVVVELRGHRVVFAEYVGSR